MAKWLAAEAFEELNWLHLAPLPLPDQSSSAFWTWSKSSWIGSSEVDGQERKSKAEDGESFDPTGGAFVAKVEAAVAELLLPGGQQHVSVVDGGTE